MTTNINRYKPDNDGRLWPAPDGEYVLYADHVAALALIPGETQPDLPPDIIESLLAIGPVEWGQTYCQSDEKHIEDFADSLRITREFFGIEAEETAIQYVSLAGTATILALTGNSPNSPQNARVIAGAWNQLVDIAKGKAASPAPLPVAVKVKPLEWQEEAIPPAGEILAPSPMGLYCVKLGAQNFYPLWLRDKVQLGYFTTIDEAKAAAQADYETRIRSALIGGDV